MSFMQPDPYEKVWWMTGLLAIFCWIIYYFNEAGMLP